MQPALAPVKLNEFTWDKAGAYPAYSHMLQKGPLTTVVEHLVKTFGTISLRFHHCQHASLALWQKGRLNCWREFGKLLHTDMNKNISPSEYIISISNYRTGFNRKP
jgi:hypothetical protein